MSIYFQSRHGMEHYLFMFECCTQRSTPSVPAGTNWHNGLFVSNFYEVTRKKLDQTNRANRDSNFREVA